MSTTKRLIKGSSIIFTGAIVGGLFSYAFNMMMGRLMGPVNYGELTALLSLLMIVTVAGGAITTIAMRYSGELIALGHFNALIKFFRFLSRNTLYLGLTLAVLGLILLKPIANFFSISEFLPIIIILLTVVLNLLVFVNKGILQGGQKFVDLTVANTIDPILRVVIGISLVKLGLGLSGAMMAIFIAVGSSYLVTLIPLKKIFRLASDKVEKFSFDKKEIIAYSWPTLIAAILLVLSINIDIVLVKHFFSPEEAGLYAAVSTIAKIILYITGPIIAVMFPMISEQKTKGEKHYRVFLMSLLFTLVGSVVVLGLYVLAPGKIISILYGPKFVNYYYLLPQIGVAILFYSLINLIVNYYLAIKNFVFLWFFALILVAQVVIISLWHPSLEAVVRVLILTLGGLFVLMFGYYLLQKKDQIVSFINGEFKSDSQA
jgi:O-antigen/teichoic acid export membrane protein